GRESSVALLKKENGYAFAIAGKVDGSARGDAGTQVMGGLIGAALHPDPRRVLVIGLGTGETAGWSAAVPGIERVSVVELEAVFPEVETWYTRSGDLLLVATAEPIAYDARRLAERLRREPFASAMEKAWRVSGLEGFLSHYVAQAPLARVLAERGGNARNTDDKNSIEFAFARSL